MSCHFLRVAAIYWVLLLLDYAAAVSKTLSPSTLTPGNAWTITNGHYVSSGSGPDTYVDFVFNTEGEQYVTLSVDAYGYTGSPTSPSPATYTIQINGQNNVYDANQARPVVINNLDPTFHYRIVLMAPSSASGMIVNSVVASRPDPPASSSSVNINPPTSSSPSSAGTSATQSSGSSTSSIPSSGALSMSNSASHTVSGGSDTISSTPGQSLGVPIFLTVSGSVISQESQTSALLSSNSSNSGPPIGLIIGPIAGVIVVMVLAALIYFRRRDQARRKRDQTEIDSYLVEVEAQQPPSSTEPTTIDSPPIAYEKSRSMFGFADRGGANSSRGSGQTPMASSATAHVSYITTITDSSLLGRAYGGMAEPDGDPFASNSRMSISSVEETAAPPAYVEREANSASRSDQS